MPDTGAPRGGARLLPWPGQDGSPAYLVSHGGEAHLAALADEVEQLQLAAGAEVLRCARPLIGEPGVSVRELRWTATRLAECLGDALRVAESRGARLGGHVDPGAHPPARPARPRTRWLRQAGLTAARTAGHAFLALSALCTPGVNARIRQGSHGRAAQDQESRQG